jgi:hypothetical protein
MTLIPAYGRDYKSGKEAKEAFDANKDFQVADLFSGGAYVNKEQLPKGTTVTIRFKQLTGVTTHKVK